MLKVERGLRVRSVEGVEDVRLVSREVSVRFGAGSFASGVSYRAPAFVETESERISIVDHVMMVRIVAIASTVLIAFARRRMR